jgi:muramoyltetrapeptide carboxypeptidase
LDYNLFRKHPKILAGFSDITALHAALQREAGWVTFHSPHPMDGIGATDGLSELSARTFWRAILGENYEGHDNPGYEVPLTDEERTNIITMVAGKSQGALVGGNLSLICAVLGTPYEFDLQGRILLLEEVAEQPYRVDRCLSQLRLGGKLDILAGVIIGQFTDCTPAEGKPSLELAEIFDTYFGSLGIPVLSNFPTGHTRDNATLPLNVPVQLDATSKRLTILENPVRLRAKKH